MRLWKTFVGIVLLICIQYAFLVIKYTSAVVILIIVECLVVERFEWILWEKRNEEDAANEGTKRRVVIVARDATSRCHARFL